MASGDNPSNAAIAAMGGGGGGGGNGQEAIAWRRWLSCPTWKWGGDVGRRWPGDIFIYKVRTFGKPPSRASYFSKSISSILGNTPCWDLC